MHGSAAIVCLIHFLITISIKSINCKVTTKIIGGKSVDIKDRPFMLSLHNSEGFVCGASILSRNWAITALHCFLSERTSNYFVRAGSNKPYEGGSLHRVIKIHVYDNAKYSYLLSGVFYHDVVLFQVKPRFRFSNTVQAIGLPDQFNRSPRKLYVCGWGYTSLQNNPRISDVLMGVFVSRTPHEICINETPEYEAIINKEYHLCYGTRGKDSCYGDSGGPLASRNTLYGVVSFGQDCAVVSGVYENVSYYRNWIKEITNL
ncbi:trypsin-1-like [Osmia bicornis bicornis]|uniref:trypsin-1-like n=1 Tax=Osmia bicornis bicornis TaxID=1437191 RepID=UPI0010F70B4E|nr:trypsin-1-like [Osmia bicornis bicornis]